MMHEWVCCHDEAANHHLPIAAAIWIIWIVSTEECSSLTSKILFKQNLIQIRCCTHSFWMTATQYTCSVSGICHPHWLVQWSHHCSYMCVPVLPPLLPRHINVMQTILIILTTAWLFLDRSHIYKVLSFQLNCKLLVPMSLYKALY